MRAELLGNESRTQFSAVSCGVASGYVFSGALGCTTSAISAESRSAASAAGGFFSATRRYDVIGDTVERAASICSQIRQGKLDCSSWAAVDDTTAEAIVSMLACSKAVSCRTALVYV